MAAAPETVVVLALELDVLEAFEVGALELVVADGEHLIEGEAEVGAVLVVARQCHNVVVSEATSLYGEQAPHQAAELVERHGHRLERGEVERRPLRLQRRLDPRHDHLDV